LKAGLAEPVLQPVGEDEAGRGYERMDCLPSGRRLSAGHSIPCLKLEGWAIRAGAATGE